MKTTISPAVRNRINRQIQKLTNNTYFDQIPLDQLFSFCQAEGLEPLQEDNTAWDGFLCGEDGEAFIFFGFHESTRIENGYTFYDERCTNAGLKMTWHKMESGRYEVVSYIS